MSTTAVLFDIMKERVEQDVKWGEQNHPDGTGRLGDLEEAAVCRAKCESHFAEGIGTWRDIATEELMEAFAESNRAKLREELVQAAAVLVAWVEAIDRRET